MSNSNSVGLEQLKSELQKAGDPWKADITSLSLLSFNEKKQYLGATPPPDKPSISEVERNVLLKKESLKAEALAAIGVPKAYDLRNIGGKNFVTPIKNQKSCGSCVAFGTIATVESTLKLEGNDPNLAVDLSEAHLFFCHGKDVGRNCSNGWWPNEALDAFKNKGVVDAECYKYVDGLVKQDCSGLCSDSNNRLMKITGYTDLTEQPAKIKEWITSKGPVSACFIVYDDFYNYSSGIYKHVTGSELGGHCVTIVGYNDDQGYWICKNSWGTDWGEQGFFRIAYGECGIDSWQNHGVYGVQNLGEQTNRKVIGLWAINEDRNAWVYFENLGWRKISPDNDIIFYNMLAQLISAKAANRPVNFHEENNIIKQVYVF